MLHAKINALFAHLHLNSQEKETFFKTFRLGIYFFVLLFLVLTLWKLAKQYGPFTFSETGPVENLQLIILLITGLFFLKDGIQNKNYRPLSLFLASLIAFAFIREQDAFLEKLIPVISWKFAWCFPALASWYMFKKRKGLKKIFFSFLDSCAFQLMFTAIIIFIPAAQCIGHRPFITDSLETSDNLVHIRRLIEESIELMAYVLIFLSSIEMHFGLIKKKKN